MSNIPFNPFNPPLVSGPIESNLPYEAFRYRIPAWVNVGQAQEVQFADDITAIGIANDSAIDTVDVRLSTPQYGTDTFRVGVKQPWLGPLDKGKFRLEIVRPLASLAGFTEAETQLSLVFYKRGVPGDIVQKRRDMYRKEETLSGTITADTTIGGFSLGRSCWDISVFAQNGAAATSVLDVVGIDYHNTGKHSDTILTQAIGAGAAFTDHVQTLLHYDAVEVRIGTIVGANGVTLFRAIIKATDEE